MLHISLFFINKIKQLIYSKLLVLEIKIFEQFLHNFLS